MKKKLVSLFIVSLSLMTVARAEFGSLDQSDFTGDAFFTQPVVRPQAQTKNSTSKSTIPPLKKLRLKIGKSIKEKELRDSELAPTAETIYPMDAEASDYVSTEEVKNYDEEILASDGFEADEEAIREQEKKKQFWFRKKPKVSKITGTEDIVLDCERVDYDSQNYFIYARGNASVRFVKQNTTVFANLITFDRVNNTIKAEENVKIVKNGRVIVGDYIFVDLNEENALIENPVTRTSTIEIKSKKGYVYSDRVVQEDGSLTVDSSFPMFFRSGNRGPQMQRMMIPEDSTLTEDMSKGIIKLKAKDIKITQKGDLEIISLKKARIFKGDKTIFKTPGIKLYTNKNNDYVETNHWEIGSYRGLGAYIGPGVVFELPKGSVFKAMPILNYKSGVGVGAVGRFSSGTNQTTIAYGSADNKMFLYGKQKLDDHLHLQYGINAYQDEWFLGRRRPKYGIGMVYKNGYASNNFLFKGHTSAFSHRVDAGFYHDMDYDKNFEKINGADTATARFRYMAQASQNLYNYRDEANQTALSLSVVSQLSAALYGTGDTQVIGRLGPNLHSQYKRWMQDIGFMFSAYQDDTPMPVYDAYRYGKYNVYLREYFRINRYLTLSWFTSLNLDDRTLNGERFQENAFYVSIGPDDFKLNLGYDLVRENLYCTFTVMSDAKGTKIEYDKLEIKQDKKSQEKEEKLEDNSYKAPVTQPVLQRAVVENVKVIEDVL